MTVLDMRNDDGDLVRYVLDDETNEVLSQTVVEPSERTQIRGTLRAQRARVLHAVLAGRADFTNGTPTAAEVVRQVKLLTNAVAILILENLDLGDAVATPDTVEVRVGVPNRRPGRAVVAPPTVAVGLGVPAVAPGAGVTAAPATVGVTTGVPHPDISTEVGG